VFVGMMLVTVMLIDDLDLSAGTARSGGVEQGDGSCYQWKEVGLCVLWKEVGRSVCVLYSLINELVLTLSG